MCKFVLVTGATGFIGAHIVDVLLARGIRVRGATRSLEKGDAMINARPQHSRKLEFIQIQDFERPGGLVEAVQGVDGVTHTASPFRYNTTNNEEELILPAMNGVRALLEAASYPKIRRIVITSSFASDLDTSRKSPPYLTDWNPLTYEASVDLATTAIIACRRSKNFAELEAWKYVEKQSPTFDLVALCPPMTFGPFVHPVNHVDELNESNAMLWNIANGETRLPVARVPFWIDVRDLADAHVQALLRCEASGKRYIPSFPERFSYGLAVKIIAEEFPDLTSQVTKEDQPVDESYGLDGGTAATELGYGYHSFCNTARDLVSQSVLLNKRLSSRY